MKKVIKWSEQEKIYFFSGVESKFQKWRLPFVSFFSAKGWFLLLQKCHVRHLPFEFFIFFVLMGRLYKILNMQIFLFVELIRHWNIIVDTLFWRTHSIYDNDEDKNIKYGYFLVLDFFSKKLMWSPFYMSHLLN